MSSAALKDLAGRLAEVQLLARLDPARRGDTSQAPLSNAVTRASLVLLSAHLEGFLEDVVTEALDALVANAPVVDELPLLLRAIHVEEHLRGIEPIKDRNARAPRIAALFVEEGELWRAGGALKPGMVRHRTVCSEMDNPGSRQVRQFLELLGVDIAAHLGDEGSDALLGQIDGLVGRRNAIAHGEATSKATFTDVDVYLQTVEELARHVDEAIAQSIRRVCRLKTLPW